MNINSEKKTTFIMDGTWSVSISKSETIVPEKIFRTDLIRKNNVMPNKENIAIRGNTQSFASIPEPE